MLRIQNLNLPLAFTEKDLHRAAARHLKISTDEVSHVSLVRKSVDARDKGDVHFVVSADVILQDPRAEERILQKNRSVMRTPAPFVLKTPNASFEERPVVVGAGPAGLFCTLVLALAGHRPILLERGRDVEKRTEDVLRLQREGTLDPQSNVQFGEGGAGAFSDGKLTTGTKSPYQHFVLETFVRHGAPEEILILQKPHIGTDRLKPTIASIRQEILSLGGEVLFEHTLSGIDAPLGQLRSIFISTKDGEKQLPCTALFLCLGHSARDTFQMLLDASLHMEPKPFAMGVRIEHPQSLISRSQYGDFASHPSLGPADYKLNVRTPDGRGVYSFCMCPGGQVIAAASEPGRLCVNGMSLHARDGENANAALLVGIRPEDAKAPGPLGLVALQRDLEEAAFRLGGGHYLAPVQRVEDFLEGRSTKALGSVRPTYLPGVTPSDLRECLPEWLLENLKSGIRQMDRQLRGFAHPDAVLTAIESRSSSPVRLLRDQSGQSVSIRGIYPCGEGAGYAGGIMSAAVDGISQAMRAMEQAGA